MSVQKENLFMSEILGSTKQEISAYFGLPNRDFSALSVYQCRGGYIIVSFSGGEAENYALYDPERKLLLATLDPVRLTDAEMDSWKNKKFEAFAEQYGPEHTDLGSGLYIPGYFGSDGCIYALQIFGDEIFRISRIRF